MPSFDGENKADEDDLYGGFEYNVKIGAPPGTAAGVGAPAAAFGGAAVALAPVGTARGGPGTAMQRMLTGRLNTGQGGGAAGPRPMTSNKGAGYSAGKPKEFDPMNAGHRGPAPPLAKKEDNSPEAAAKEMEKKVNTTLEESAQAVKEGDTAVALERAKDAGKKERKLCQFREGNGLADQVNLDLTYAVCFNLASCYEANGMFNEALNTYNLIVKNKQYPQAGRLRVNMGNIHFKKESYLAAVKQYRMALDQIPNTGKEIRFKIMRNIGNAFVKMGQFQDAVQSYESVMDGEGSPDIQTGFNLVVCYFALGDQDKMRKGFSKLLAVPIEGVGEHEDDEDDDDEEAKATREEDPLYQELKRRQKRAVRFITMASKLIAGQINQENWAEGFDWVIEALRREQEKIASEMEISKSMTYLRNKDFNAAIDVLKSFEKKDQRLKARAATNLSFLYYLEGDMVQADNYANLAVRHDRYNAKALVNKGNCLYVKGEFERAKELYLEAIGVEADCVQAIYNLGLVNKRMGVLNEALQAFEKLHSIISSSPEVIYQIANLHDMMGNYRSSTKWFNIVITRVPSDPGVLSRLGQIFNKDDDETQAFHFHLESYRYFPVNLDVISWLGVWYVKSEFYEKAIHFFERAAEIQPHEVKWKLMVTSCYRRMGSYQQALELYEDIHHEYPENLECLRYLVAICKDLGMKYDHYQKELAKLERTSVQQQQQQSMMAAPRQAMSRDRDEAPMGRGGGGGGGGRGGMDGGAMSGGRPNGHGMDSSSPGGRGTAGGRGGGSGAASPSSPQGNSKIDESDDWGDADLDELLAD